VVTAQDYYPFGMQMEGRTAHIAYDATTQTYNLQNGAGNYRYGFNGKENDNEVKGTGNQQDYGMRIYDPRVGRFLSTDPITSTYPMLTPYQFASNRPVDGIDQDGLEYAKDRITVDFITGKILFSDIIWHDPNQHNSYGDRGPGIVYEISVYDSKLKRYRGNDIQAMIKRVATKFGVVSTDYGNYYGATGLRTVDHNGHFTNTADYSIPPIDMVDRLAYKHDKGYDALKSTGENGLFDDWGTTPIDEMAASGWRSFTKQFSIGDRDPYNKQKIPRSEMIAAYKGYLLFDHIIANKKESISKFMQTFYPGIAENIANASSVQNENQIQYNYKLFLERYLHKNENGDWVRKEEMWTKDEHNNYVPLPMPKL